MRWSIHSKERFAERAVALGINYGDIEFEVKKREFKLLVDGNKFKSIFPVGSILITVLKIDNPEWIKVITLWESNEEEAILWRNR